MKSLFSQKRVAIRDLPYRLPLGVDEWVMMLRRLRACDSVSAELCCSAEPVCARD